MQTFKASSERPTLPPFFKRTSVRWGTCVLVLVTALAAVLFSASLPTHAAGVPVTSIGHTSSAEPSIVSDCNGSGPVIAYRGTNGEVYIYYMNKNVNVRTYQDSPYAPAIACYNKKLWYAFWEPVNKVIGVTEAPAASTSGSIYTPYPVSTDSAPVLTTCNGVLYLGWEGTDSSHHLHLMKGVETNADKTITLSATAQAGTGLSLTCFNNQVYVSWITPYINIGVYNPASGSFSSSKMSSDTSDHHPAISITSGNTYSFQVAWKGKGNTYLNTTWYAPTDKKLIGKTYYSSNTTPYSPGLGDNVPIGGKYQGVPVVYTGTDHEIYYGTSFFAVG